MRVIAGKYKGKNLSEFTLGTTRPTADMVREALFDKIGLQISGKTFLDLFAGTGAIGIEALSRNAEFCWFVDAEKKAIDIINKNLNLVRAENCQVLNLNFEDAIKKFKANSQHFDFVFLDPPYKTEFAERAIFQILENGLLENDGLIVWEHDDSKLDFVKSNFPDCITKKYGKKFLTYIYL